jgi:hypothetical protein
VQPERRDVMRRLVLLLVPVLLFACAAPPTPTPSPDPGPRYELEAKTFAIESLFKLLSTAQGVGGLERQEFFAPVNYVRVQIADVGKLGDGTPVGPADLADTERRRELDGSNWVQLRWATENWRPARAGLPERWRLMSGETEMRSIGAEVINFDTLTAADRANGVEWRAQVRLTFASRSRATVTMGPEPARPGPPDHLYGGWRNEAFVWTSERRAGAWSNPEPVRFVLLPLKVLELATLHARHDDCAEIRTGCRITA